MFRKHLMGILFSTINYFMAKSTLGEYKTLNNTEPLILKEMPIAANAIEKKIERFHKGEKLRVLDLFSGCGGLSLGFHKAGFDITAAVEMDKEAANSHASNFHFSDPNFELYSKSRDIQKTTAATLFKDLGFVGNVSEHIDMIVGGPPCQAFTRIGRAKLREVFSDDEAFLNDPRGQLYKRYLKYVQELKPLAILMENVPDFMNYGGVNIADLVCKDLTNNGYKCRYTLLNCVYYGVPQMRERMFLIAVHNSINAEIKFPAPTHYTELPKGYYGSRSVALKNIKAGVSCKYYMSAEDATENLPSAISAQEATSDLPGLRSHLTSKVGRGKNKLNAELAYKQKATNEYQLTMRQWPGFECKEQVSGNLIRILPRDYPIFQKMKPGDQYPEAVKVAKKILTSKITKEEKAIGKNISERSKKYQKLVKETIPPYDVKKFPNKWRKMEADKPARTLMAHLGKDSYSHIHYDSKQARTISVREAARLQSFPDGFHFSGAMNAAFRQIGNAVPPLMAEKIAMTIKELLSKGVN
jgi:DNA (cytosine-5)-methyltransferase 1